tara:strand:+ start:196 stop:477 length:282 start_codon:yes stop_codon:yes gene_type:complete
MKALILNGKVVDTASTEFEVHSSMTWVDCADTVKVGDSYDGSKFTSSWTDEQNTAAIKVQTDKIAAQKTGNDKLLALGLTQAEATALTGYTPS